MPGKKRTHGRKKSKQQSEALTPGGGQPGRSSDVSQTKSQPKQSTSTPAAPASSAKLAQYEKGAAKPATTTASPASTTAKPATTTASPASTTAKPAPTTVVAGTTSTSTAPKSTATTVAAGSVTATVPKVTGAVAEPMAGKGNKDGSSKSAQSSTVSSSKPDPPKGPPKPTPVTNITASTTSKVKSEVPAKTSAPASDDPFDALADSLPSAEPVAPEAPQFTGPAVHESAVSSKDAPRCGVRDDTLPPGYRMADMEKKMPAGEPVKPKAEAKPLSQDEALDSLSAGFVSSPPKPETTHETVAPVSANKNFSPPPPAEKIVNKQAASANLSPAPPADKKAKMEKASPAVQSVKPKAEVSQQQKKTAASGVAEKPKEIPMTEDMSLDALDALGDTLPVSKPVPKAPEVKPQDIVNEKSLTSKKGVRVGERDDSLPPEYRFKEDKSIKQPPALPKEPSLDPSEALDILSGDFSDSCAAPTVQSLPPPAPVKQQPQVEDLSALDALADDFVAPAQANKVSSSAPPAAKSAPPTTGQSDDMSLDALEALGDMLPSATPVPEAPELRPEDIVDETSVTSKKGVLVGEREDTLPPNYRFPKEDPKKHPEPPKPEPSMDPLDALDILSGDFTTPTVAPAVQAPVPPSAPPAESLADFSLEDVVAPSSALTVKSTAPIPPKADPELDDLSALDALSDTLAGIGETPEPVPVTPKEEVKEKLVVEEKLKKAGETDDSLPPEFRPTEADKKAAAEAKSQAKAGVPDKQTSIDESEALEMLSSDFSDPSPVPPVCQALIPPAKASSTPKVTGPVLDKLASTLLPDLSESKPTDRNSKGKGRRSKSNPKKPAVADVPAVESLPGKPSADVVSSIPAQKGGKS